MKKKWIYQISILVATTIVTVGCSSDKAPQPPKKVTQTAPAPVVSSGITIANLKSSGISTVSLRGNKSYKQGSAIQFIVNTMNKVGYLYIIYLDNKGNTGLLYPNKNSPLTELSGEYLFPRDFGNMNIRATKDCGNCPQEKTTVYALLSKEPITDIENITKAQLTSFMKRPASQSKGLSMTTNSPRANDSNLDVGRLEFLVQ